METTPCFTIQDVTKMYFEGISSEFVTRWLRYIDFPREPVPKKDTTEVYVANHDDFKTARELLESEAEKVGGRKYYHPILGRFTISQPKRKLAFRSLRIFS